MPDIDHKSDPILEQPTILQIGLYLTLAMAGVVCTAAAPGWLGDFAILAIMIMDSDVRL